METKFVTANFNYSGGYLTYVHNGKSHFIARFKYRGPFTKSIFVKQLVKRFSVESYLKLLEVDHIAPLVILERNDPVWYRSVLNKFLSRVAA